MSACDACLRRARLLGLLAPRIAGLLDRPGSRSAGILALSDTQLTDAVAGEAVEEVHERMAEFDAESERSELVERGIGVVCRHRPGFPEQLGDLHDPPTALFAVGELAELERAVAIVGSRSASPYGLEVAYELGRGLGAAGVTVVSGLALGIDAAAHRGCLDGGGRGVAVLAGGPDVIYPRQNGRLYEQVAASGAVISELPPGTRPYRWSFPARNRIMAGLSELTVLVEAADPSGSLITAEFARDIGRAVGAVPGRVTSRFAAGTNGLLRDGAIPITGAQDVLDELFGAGALELASARLPSDPALQGVLEGIEAGRNLGELAASTGLSVREARAALARLEADGLVKRSGLGSYERAAGR
jgi:DNA processing protein